MTEVKITPEQGSDTQAHIDAMVAKADGKATPAQASAQETPEAVKQETPERPAWLPEKFATPEDMAKAYGEMEKKQSGGQETPETPADASADGSLDETQEAAQAAVASAGLDMEALGNKIVANGELDASDYEALEKQGITKEMVSTYVAGQQALGDQLVAEMHDTVGGQETFDGILEWAAEELPADEIKAFNSTVDTGSTASIKLALQGLHAKYNAAGQNSPNLIGGKNADANAGDVFRSTAELTKAMSDPRYSRDAAYRQDVTNKLARSSII